MKKNSESKLYSFINYLSKKKLSKYLIFLSIILLFYTSLFIIKPSINQIPYSTTIYDTNNIKIGEIITDNKYRHEKLSFEEIPEFTKKSIINLEDKTFYQNNGIDYLALIRAIKNNISNTQILEGASTISSQVIRNNYWLNAKRTFLIKLREFYLSLALNKNYSKDEILTNYLGNIYFGYLNYGIKSASNYYFGKDLQNLTKAEQIALISLPKNPKKYDPYKNRQEFKTRFKIVTTSLLKNKILTNEEYNSIINEKLEFNENHENKLPYVVDYLKGLRNEKSELTNINCHPELVSGSLNCKNPLNDSGSSPEGQSNIQTTIDFNLTNKIDELAKNSIIPLMWKNVKDYSVIIIDRKTQELKVMIGGIDYYGGQNGQVNMTTSPRQVGSTIKPFTYVLAFKNLGYTPNTTIIDLPVQFQTDLGYAYNPKNYSLDYKGEVTIAQALSQSINIPALKVAEKVGVNNLLQFLKSLGITSLNKDENYYGLALTLGVGEISLYELTKAFTIFAYDGKLCDINVIVNNNGRSHLVHLNKGESLSDSESRGINSCKQIIEKKYTDMIGEILTNRYYKLGEFPINGNLDFPDKKVFLKTGTSRNFKDNWTVGFTDNYIIGVWAGNKDGSEMKGVSGASGAGEIFKNVVDYLEKDNGQSDIKKLKKENINYLEITSPLNNSKFKIDNFKPQNTQKIKLDFSTNLVYDSYKWFVNNTEIKDKFLNLKTGKKEIKLVLYDKNGNIVKKEKNWIFIE
ncbi:MAG: transglycosylase domain-containing protein [Candidatus Gracilibacteria bacterium]